MNRKHWLILTVLALCLVVLAGDTGLSEIPTFKRPNLANQSIYTVTRVVDGDTFVVSDGDESIKVKLIGVETPETMHPKKSVQYYGREAGRFLNNLLKGERVYLIPDIQGDKINKHGRTLTYAYRYPDGLFVNAEIIRQGYGHAYTQFPFVYMEKFRQLESFARNARKGLWGKKGSTLVPITDPSLKVTVYVTRTGQKYHRDGCGYLLHGRIPIGLKQAKAKGYTRCSACGPQM